MCDYMKKTLLYYKPEYVELAENLRDNYRAHGYEKVDIISEEEQDDIEYARKMEYDEAIYIEDFKIVIVHDIKSWYTTSVPIENVYYKD